MYMHMAMAVMRIAFIIVSCFYLSGPRVVKRSPKKHPPPVTPPPLELFPDLPMIFPETLS
jgi:PBP1b-binding outer membrane lipoprotein LpoB